MSFPVGSSFRFRKQSLDEWYDDHELDVEDGGQTATVQIKKSPGKPSRVLLLTLFMGLALAGVGLYSLLMDSPFLAAVMQHRNFEGMTQRLPSATELELEAPLGNLDQAREDSPFLAAMMQYRRSFRLGCKYLRMELKYRGFEGMTQGLPSAMEQKLEVSFEQLDEELENAADTDDAEQLVGEEAFEAESSMISAPPSVDVELAQSHEEPEAQERPITVDTLADAHLLLTPDVELVEEQEKVENSNVAQGVGAAAFAPNTAPEAEPQVLPQAAVQKAPAQVKTEATTTGAVAAVVSQQAVAVVAKAAVTQEKTQRAARQTAAAQKPARVKQSRRDSKRQAGRGDVERRAGRRVSKHRAGRRAFDRRTGRGDSKRRGESERRGGRGDFRRNAGRKHLDGRGKKRSGGRRGGEF